MEDKASAGARTDLLNWSGRLSNYHQHHQSRRRHHQQRQSRHHHHPERQGGRPIK